MTDNYNPKKLTMPFGKHKGKMVKDLPLPYCIWLINESVFDKKSGKLKAAVQEKLQETYGGTWF